MRLISKFWNKYIPRSCIVNEGCLIIKKFFSWLCVYNYDLNDSRQSFTLALTTQFGSLLLIKAVYGMESSLFFTFKLVLCLFAVANALHDKKESLRVNGRKNILMNENSLGQNTGELEKRSTVDSDERTNDKKEKRWQSLNVKRFNVGRRSPCGDCPCSWGCTPGPSWGFGGQWGWGGPSWGFGGPWGCTGGPCGCTGDRWCRKSFFILVISCH